MTSALSQGCPAEDKTPIGYEAPQQCWRARVKDHMRELAYPLLRRFSDLYARRCVSELADIHPDYCLYGYRGNGYFFLRNKVNAVSAIRGKHILIAGCGTGRDVLSWLRFGPASVTGVDYFNYDRAWSELKQVCKGIAPATDIKFMQSDLRDMSGIASERYDFVCSDAVLEHVTDIDRVLAESRRILVEGGVFYSTFGPLWPSWGGDHISGWDGIGNGYNHLLLDKKDYELYLASKGPFQHSEDDGRTWVFHGLFSYLGASDYVRIFEGSGFKRELMGVVIDPRAVEFLSRFPGRRDELLKRYSYLDLVVSTMTMIYRKGEETE